jgi:serine phosphatase RsbU (regulator of sigma subunit)
MFNIKSVLKNIFLIVLLTVCSNVIAQKKVSINIVDSLNKIEIASSENEKIETYIRIARVYLIDNPDSSLLFYKKAEDVAKTKNLEQYLPIINIGKSIVLTFVTGNYPLGLVYAYEGLKYVNKNIASGNNKYISAVNLDDANLIIAYAYACLGNKPKAHEYLKIVSPHLLDTTKVIGKKRKFLDNNTDGGLNQFLTKLYIHLQEYDNAEKYLKAIFNNKKIFTGYNAMLNGKIFKSKNLYDSAIHYFTTASQVDFFKDKMEAYALIAECYQQLNQNDSAILYAYKVIELSKDHIYSEGELSSNKLLYEVYQKRGIKDSAYKYIVQYVTLKNKIFDNIQANNIQSKIIEEQLKSEEALNDQKEKNRFKILAIIFSISFVIILYFIVLYNQKKKIKQFEDNRKTQELEVAKALQLSFLPKALPSRDDLEIAAFMRSSTEVGGDYYDFIIQKDGSIFSICGDATGHGVASGMMVSVTKTGLNSINELAPNMLLKTLNQVIKKLDLGKLRMSLNIVKILENKILITSAAMPPLFLYKASTQEVEEILQINLPLGSLNTESFELIERTFEKGDVLLQLSDGLPEAPNKNGELFDYHRVQSLLALNGKNSAAQIKSSLIESADNWLEGANNPDDITFIVIKKITE